MRDTFPPVRLPRLALVVSRYNESITGRLLSGAIEEYERLGGQADDIEVFNAPGSYELVVVANAAARSERFAGVVALGCLVKGETKHDEFIAHAVAQGLASISVVTGVPVAFGVLTVNTPAQARARAGGAKGNKGAEAVSACLETIASVARVAGGPASPFALGMGPSSPRPDKAHGRGSKSTGRPAGRPANRSRVGGQTSTRSRA
ncbi:MAG: 6,7-dimethyl-8-ribityllumazine synthase [Planctomycetota bacterium]|nr:6,7-dimethyl-8-ribityllumazine synthase [Planctomycetota bacterium]